MFTIIGRNLNSRPIVSNYNELQISRINKRIEGFNHFAINNYIANIRVRTKNKILAIMFVKKSVVYRWEAGIVLLTDNRIVFLTQ